MRARIIHTCGCSFEVGREDRFFKEHTEMRCPRHGQPVQRIEYFSDQRPTTKESLPAEEA